MLLTIFLFKKILFTYLMEKETMSKCVYAGLNNLSDNLDHLLDTSAITHVNVIAYKINTSNQTPTPYLTVLLFNNTPGEMNIPVVCLLDACYDQTPQLTQHVQKELIKLLNIQNYNRDSCEGIEFKGFFLSNNEIYMFYDLSYIDWSPYDALLKQDRLWFGLIDEIVNVGTICNLEINAKLTIFFLEHPFFGFLEDDKGNELEVPIVAYRGKRAQELNFTFVFGVSQSDKNEAFGPYYYFTDYRTAIKQSGCNDVTTCNKKGGVIRFALFMNKTMIIDNLSDNEPDWSSTKCARLTDASLNINYENSTIRITDHDGNWTSKYDSVFAGRVMLDNGKELEGLPIFVVKRYEQQQPLSYHLIDSKHLNERTNEPHIM